MDLDNAIAKHAEWKIKFRHAISKKEPVDAATLSKDNSCELGQWLHGDARMKFGTLASHSACIAKHAAFHVEAAKVAALINARKYQEAQEMLDSETTYGSASRAVALAIMGLRKEAGL